MKRSTRNSIGVTIILVTLRLQLLGSNDSTISTGSQNNSQATQLAYKETFLNINDIAIDDFGDQLLDLVTHDSSQK
jgi:hypothetical protein